MRTTIALVRSVSPKIVECELTHLDRTPIDLAKARREHEAYVEALAELGCRVEFVPGAAEYPDSVFVEDTAVVFDEVAIIARPGSPSRRGETPSVAASLSPYRPLLAIEAPGTLDGGDVLTIGQRVFVGITTRTNRRGVEQLREHLRRFDYRVDAVPLRDCLHLKTAVSALDEETVPLQSDWIDAKQFTDFRCLESAPSEPFAANAVRVGDTLIYPDRFPSTQEKLESEGYRLRTVPLGELAKAEAGPTCCSLLLSA